MFQCVGDIFFFFANQLFLNCHLREQLSICTENNKNCFNTIYPSDRPLMLNELLITLNQRNNQSWKLCHGINTECLMEFNEVVKLQQWGPHKHIQRSFIQSLFYSLLLAPSQIINSGSIVMYSESIAALHTGLLSCNPLVLPLFTCVVIQLH